MMKADWKARVLALIAQAPKTFNVGVRASDTVTLLGGEATKDHVWKLLKHGVQLGLLFVGGPKNERRYFLTPQQARDFRVRPKPCLPAVRPRKPPSTAWKAETACRPAHVKVQQCPCGTDRRFSVPDGFVGPFATLGPGKYLDEHAS